MLVAGGGGVVDVGGFGRVDGGGMVVVGCGVLVDMQVWCKGAGRSEGVGGGDGPWLMCEVW